MSIFVPTNGTSPTSKEAYQLFTQDLVAINFFDEPELNTESRVDSAGNINLPLIGIINVEGKTINETEESIEQEYIRQEYLRRPSVTIFVKEYGPKEVVVLGEVKKPGNTAFPVEENQISIVNVISIAGGFTKIAKQDEVQVTRTLPNGEKKKYTLNVKKMLSGNSSKKPDFLIVPGDIVFVDQRIF